MNFKTFRNLALGATIFVTSFTACDDEVTVLNKNEINAEIFFETAEQIESASIAIYGHFQTIGLYQRFGYVIPDTMSDESNTSGDPNFQPSFLYSVTPNLDQTATYWTQCFNGIAKANFLLDNEDKMRSFELIENNNVTKAVVDQAVGEAKFLRALYYFHLVNLYGGVPIFTSVSDDTDGSARNTEEEVFEQIITDLEDASALLPTRAEQSDEGRATSGAAYALLGRANLYTERYQDAKDALNNVTGYNLLPLENYSDNFSNRNEHNDESIFEINFSTDANNDDLWSGGGLGLSEITFHSQEYTGWRNAVPSQKMLDEFESNDPRRDVAITTDGAWQKFSQLYNGGTIAQNSDVNARLIRYADVVLMKAEVENELGNLQAAIDYLNEIRDRATMPRYGTPEMNADYPVADKAGVFNAIVHERMVELCAEQLRFYDLKRWGLDGQELMFNDAGESRGYNPETSKFLPIPQVELDANKNPGMFQNPGY